MSREFEASLLARAWLSVTLASGKEKEVPLLNRTVAVEEFEDGVRLVATDRYVILYCWVPAVGRETMEEPDLASAPGRTVVAVDPYGRARGFLAYVLSLCYAMDEDDPQQVIVTLDLDVVGPDDGEDPDVFDGMDREWVVLEYPGHERVRLGTVAGIYPAWRSPTATFKPQRTGDIALNPEIIGRLAKIGRYHPSSPLLWHFGGADKAARIEIGVQPHVHGFVMPVRWEFDAAESDLATRVGSDL